jgi:hypothetical protein
MRRVTRERPKTDRIARPRPIARFIDPAAGLLHVPADRVSDVARSDEATAYDAPEARYAVPGAAADR